MGDIWRERRWRLMALKLAALGTARVKGGNFGAKTNVGV
jgi:hypothetical protein